LPDSLVALFAAACSGGSATPAPSLSPATSVAAATATAAPAESPTATPAASADPTPVPAQTPLARVAWKKGLPVVRAKLVSPGVGWVLATTGVFETNDDGKSWANVTPAGLKVSYTVKNASLQYSNVVGLGALDGQHAFLATSSAKGAKVTITVWRTTNGGMSWQHAAAPAVTAPLLAGGIIGSAYPPVTFDVVDAKHAFFSFYETSGMDTSVDWVFGTSDGGATWKSMPYTVPADATSLPPGVGVYFRTPTSGIFEFERVAFSTSSGWGKWAQIDFPSSPLDWINQPVYFLGPNDWVVSGASDGTTFAYAKSGNQGKTWVMLVHGLPTVPSPTGAEVTFISDFVWVAAIESPTGRHAFVTTDNGQNWTALADQPNSSRPDPAVCVDQMHAWAPPEFTGKLYATEDGGATWKVITP
jgi:photosystem II stability/assembly factor-like uncharacterized protein